MINRTTRALLLAIALGLWANVVSGWLRPTIVSAGAQDVADLYSVMSNVDSTLSSIQSDVSGMETALGRIQRGACSNDKIC